jgi:peroxin-1
LCDNFTGADLQALLYNSQLEAIHDALSLSPLGPQKEAETPSQVSIFALSKKPGGLHGAVHDIVERVATIRDSIQGPNSNVSNSTQQQNKHVEVQLSHIQKALATSRPSVSTKERKQYEQMYLWKLSINSLCMRYQDFLGSRGDFGITEYKGPRQTLA